MGKQSKKVKDKWYNLAKEQGYRARSAFKLVQLNQKYGFLEKAKCVIDLCAAPGGWLQVAARSMPSGSTIIGLDLDPIKPIRGVKTFVEDIRTQHCRQTLKKEMNGLKADAVLHDGAPNVGVNWAKDAFGQCELVLHSLKLAVEMLKPGGIFVTKVFRSADYNALMWVLKQFFKSCQATKPISSRNESAEIFVVCQDFIAPDKIDPRMLDPAYVFKQVDADAQPIVDVLHAKSGEQKRHRGGYDESKGLSLRAIKSVNEFIASEVPVRILTDYNELIFDDESADLLEHKLTTEEIKLCLADLKVLNKSDFKGILKWRLAMIEYREELNKGEEEDKEEEEEDKEEMEVDEEAEEEALLEEKMTKMTSRALARAKREKKKKLKLKSKARERLANGIAEGTSVDQIQNYDEEIFNLGSIRTKQGLDMIQNVDLGLPGSGDMIPDDEDEDMGVKVNKRVPQLKVKNNDEWDSEDEKDYLVKLEEDMDNAYLEYQRKKAYRDRQPAEHKMGVMAKRKKETEILKTMFSKETDDDAAYIKLLAKKHKSKRLDGDSDDDIEDSDEEENAPNPLLNHPLANPTDDISEESRANRWFQNTIFSGIEVDEEKSNSKKRKRGSDDEDVDVSLPRDNLDKTKRSTKRKKMTEKAVAKEARKSKKNDGFDIALDEDEDEDEEMIDNEAAKKKKEVKKVEPKVETEVQKKRREEKEKLIRAGMGSSIPSTGDFNDENEDFEVVPKESVVADWNPEIGSEEHIHFLALATKMKLGGHSVTTDIVDASYNRYAHADDAELPEWFIDDEKVNNRPQIPVTKEMVNKIRARYREMSAAPIGKVAEANARRKMKEFKDWKKKKQRISSVSESTDMTDSAKKRAIEKMYRGKGKVNKPSKVYVVAKSGGDGKKSGRKVKFVDSKMRKDTKSLKRQTDGKHKKRVVSKQSKSQKRR